ncbi:MAG: hypothetical protein AAFY26_02170 [Cyanobacteria bacterium J06638_22]
MHTRQETIRLSGYNSNRLTYLEKTKVVVPAQRIKREGKQRDQVLYSDTQIEILRQLRHLEQWFNIETLRSYVRNDPGVRQRIKAFLTAGGDRS